MEDIIFIKLTLRGVKNIWEKFPKYPVKKIERVPQ